MKRTTTLPLSLPMALAIALAAGCSADTGSAPAAGHDAGAATAVADLTPSGTAPDPHAAGHHAPGEHAAAEHDHAHTVAHAAGVDFPVPEHHTPWAPDAPLVAGMSRVRGAVSRLEDRTDDATVAAAVAEVDAAVDYMFANCSLPTEPDVALHAILARLMAGSEALKENPADPAAVADMQGALANYEQLFDDPAS